jgi:mono/diheme cytochrome c family protein
MKTFCPHGSLLACVVVVGTTITALTLAALFPLTAAQAGIQLPQGPNRELVYGKCRTCHDLQYLKDSKGIGETQWQSVLDDMKTYGLETTDQQHQQILHYLTTYLGPKPPPASNQQASVATQQVSGKTVFNSQCSACHQPNGQGVSGEFPPLAGNKDLFIDHDYPVYVVLNGLRGAIKVNGAEYNGQMPSFDFLSNKQIAAVVQYVRGAWGNKQNRPKGMPTVSTKNVATARQKPMNSEKVHEYRGKTG